MRPGLFVVLCWVLGPGTGWAWHSPTHQKLTRDAVSSVSWLDSYQRLSPTPFDKMVHDVLGAAEPVGPRAFKFFRASTRRQKHREYIAATETIQDPALKNFARHLLLGPRLELPSVLQEDRRPVSAREILATYSAEPDWTLDGNLDAVWYQGRPGSKAFRHMSFLFGALGQGPKRAQRFFDLGAAAIEKGHPYWGFRFVAWAMHYLEDAGTPVHTLEVPTSKYVRLKGMLFPKDPATGRRRFNRRFPVDIAMGLGTINANYHHLYELYVDRVYSGKAGGGLGQALSAAARGQGVEHSDSALSGPRTVKGLVRRRAWSRLSAPGVARGLVRFFGGAFRGPGPGAPSNKVGLVIHKPIAEKKVAAVDRRADDESHVDYTQRLTGRQLMLNKTLSQFRKNGVAVRRMLRLLRERTRSEPRCRHSGTKSGGSPKPPDFLPP